MRLDRFVAKALQISRSEAHKVIKSGVVRSNCILRNPSIIINPSDEIYYLETKLNYSEQKRYILLNKPAGFVCSHTAEASHKSALDLIDLPDKQILHFAGRLDADTTGAVIITDDGNFSHRVTSKHFFKTYIADLIKPIDLIGIKQLKNGVQLRGEKRPTNPAKVEIVCDKQIRLTINEGKYHQVKRMVAAIGNGVVKLHRENIGSIALDIDLGAWRHLKPCEVEAFLGSNPNGKDD